MPTEDVVRWLRSEHDDMRKLAGRLRESIARPPRGGRENWIVELRARFGDFAARARERMAQEEENGYLRPVLDARPSLAAQVDLLKHEHAELARIIDAVHRAVHQLTAKDNLLLRDCCKRIEDLLFWVERHEEHENHIVLYAFAKGTGART